MNPDPLLLTLQSDLLGNIIEYAADIKKCSENITTQIREIIAARVIALFERGPDGEHRLLATCPNRKSTLFNEEEIKRLVASAASFEQAALIEPGKGQTGLILAGLDMKESFVIPLRVGGESFGMLLLLDLMDSRGARQILETLQDISGLLSLVFKNSFLFRNMEYLVEQRTRALQDSESLSQAILETAMDGFWVVDMQGRLLEVNATFCRMSGYSQQELLNMRVSDLDVIEEFDDSAAHIRKVLTEGEDRFESRHRRKDGSIFHVEVSVQYRPLAGGQLVAFLRDITERKKAEETLEKSKALYHDLVETSQDLIWQCDAEGRYTYLNPAWEKVFAYSIEEMLGRKFSDFQTPEIATRDQKEFGHLLQGNTVRGWETTHIGKAGNKIQLIFNAVFVLDKNGEVKGTRGTAYDITKRKHLEEERKSLQTQLQHAQKMEAIGTLAGGIAHDFNNILSAILGYAELAQDDCPAGSILEGEIKQILKAGNRAKDLVKQILAFSRQAEAKDMPLQPAIIIKEAIKMLRSSLPSTIDIKQDIDAGAGPILADATQIHQIVMNLGTNAYHAMEETGGTLSISLKKTALTQNDLLHEPHVLPGEFVQLTVSDSGSGIAPEIRERIFDPYFTTKEVGKGTGMGLAIIHGIVKSRGGSVSCQSRPGAGTVFQVLLPIIAEPALLEEQTATPPPRGSEHILFIDDEEMLLEMGKYMLERLGYRVTTRKSSIEALTTFQNQPQEFDLVITDQTMPVMTGSDLARRMLQIRRDLPIILCTGYSSIISEDKAKSFGIKGFALKPLVRKDIGALIRKVLD